ncbi:MAG: UbiA family prenyltransferase [Chloroflexota bacterium]
MILKHLPKLILNHVDAWGITLIISMVALVMHPPFQPTLIGIPVILAFCYWLGFAVNDYFDAPFDGQDAKKGRGNFFVHHPITRLQAVSFFGLTSVLLAVLFATFGLKGIIVVSGGLFAIWAYSAPPLRLKSRPVFDLLMHMIFVQTFPYLACLVLTGLAWTHLDTALLSIFILTSLSAQLEQQLRDYAVDLQTDRNFTTTFGAPTSAFLLKLTSGTLIILFTYYILAGIIPTSLLPFGLLFLPLLIHRFFRGALAARPETLGRALLIAALVYMGYVSTSGLFNLR